MGYVFYPLPEGFVPWHLGHRHGYLAVLWMIKKLLFVIFFSSHACQNLKALAPTLESTYFDMVSSCSVVIDDRGI